MAIDVATAVEDFWIARKHGEFFPRAYYDQLTSDDAYRIQLALIDRRVAAGEGQIGWKVGLTSKAIQNQFGFHEPIFACVLETQPSGHGCDLRRSPRQQRREPGSMPGAMDFGIADDG